MALVDAMTHPAANKTCLASHVSIFFAIVLTTAKLEKLVVDDHSRRERFLSLWQQRFERETMIMKPDSVSGNYIAVALRKDYLLVIDISSHDAL